MDDKEDLKKEDLSEEIIDAWERINEILRKKLTV